MHLHYLQVLYPFILMWCYLDGDLQCVSLTDLFQLERKQIPPPYKPRVDGERDLENFDPQFTAEPVQFTPDEP